MCCETVPLCDASLCLSARVRSKASCSIVLSCFTMRKCVRHSLPRLVAANPLRVVRRDHLRRAIHRASGALSTRGTVLLRRTETFMLQAFFCTKSSTTRAVLFCLVAYAVAVTREIGRRDIGLLKACQAARFASWPSFGQLFPKGASRMVDGEVLDAKSLTMN